MFEVTRVVKKSIESSNLEVHIQHYNTRIIIIITRTRFITTLTSNIKSSKEIEYSLVYESY